MKINPFIVWGEYDDKAVVKDENGDLWEWRIIPIYDHWKGAGCTHMMALKKLDLKK